jgi:hypothetical protein
MRWFLWVYLAACGSVPANKPADAPPSIDAPRDAAGSGSGSAPACDVTKPFGTPMSVPGIDGSGDQIGGWFSPDLLTIYFNQLVPGLSVQNVYSAQRATGSDAFGTPMRLAGVQTDSASVEQPKVTANGLNLFMDGTASGSARIYVATRTTTLADFGAPALVAAVNSTDTADADAWINADATIMYLASVRPGSSSYDIYSTTRSSPTGTFATPAMVTELASTSVDDAPIASDDGLEIFFASTRSTTSNGRNDIYHATRASTSDPFSAISKVSELSTDASEDFPTWLSPDRCTLMYTSDVAGGSGGYDIWIATRPQ